ncbi:AAA domain-containing protein [Actinocorallia lasiicapitis]
MREVVEYWRAVELFDPPALPKVERGRGGGERRVEEFRVGPRLAVPILPWEARHPLQAEVVDGGRYGAEWRHTVFGGVYELKEVRDALADRFGGDVEDHAGRHRQETAVFAFTVDHEGRLLHETLVFSSCAWATGRILDPGPTDPAWLDGFTDAQTECGKAVATLTGTEIPYADPGGAWRPVLAQVLGGVAEAAVGAFLVRVAGIAAAGALKPVIERASGQAEDAEEEPPSRSVALPDIVAFAAHVADVCGVGHLLQPTRLRVQSFLVRRNKDGELPEPEPAFLNSLLPDDLERVDSFGPALASYLSAGVRAAARVDVRHSPWPVFDGLAPRLVPQGRWPAPTGQALSASQQFAVNRIHAELAASGLFSVNGPPGTGKTTMLRDLIAAIIVDRAHALAALPSPAAAFTGTVTYKTHDNWPRKVHRLAPALTGFEIVVASSNNKAVENITAELPAEAAIGAEWREASHFRDVATALLDGAPAWGTIAAPLGNASKRKQFRERFWWGDDGMQKLLKSLTEGAELDDGGPVLVDWEAAVARFREAIAQVERLRAERQALFDALRLLQTSPVDPAEATALEAETGRARIRADELIAEQSRVSVFAYGLEGELTALGPRPGLFSRVVRRSAVRQWEDDQRRLLRSLTLVGDDLAQIGRRVEQAVHRVAELDSAAWNARRAVQVDAAARVRAVELLTEVRRNRPDARVPDRWASLPDDERELSAPWADEEWLEARTKAFLAGLDLHRVFTACAAEQMYRNLTAFHDLLKSGAMGVPQEAVEAMWQSLFLIVPVISTTFASCGRLLAPLGAESIGWLLVDEAGQATPQAAVGALWRSRRAVFVGDPLQLEPVITLPAQVQELLRNSYGVGPQWLPDRNSAQGLADRVNRWGTTVERKLPNGVDEPVWVGAPLRVHRRCEQPMFTISNTIAYRGLMVSDTVRRPFPSAERPYRDSAWMDVKAAAADGKWVPAEGAALVSILGHLTGEFGVPFDAIRVLSPFREVIDGCRRSVRELAPSSFVSDAIGTVHTMQGREADVVIVVLGTHPERGEASRAWAAESPNLLNVAVSRARRRLFVIGDRSSWRRQPHFDVLAAELPHHHWRAR